MTSLLEQATQRRIALIGNGPIGRAAAQSIDGYDLVVRMNRADLCGGAGRRTDILVMLPPSHMLDTQERARPTNPLALRQAGQFWFICQDSPEERAAAVRLAGQRPIEMLGQDIYEKARQLLREFHPEGKLMPSTGLVTILTLQQRYRDGRITLFGFSHEGSRRHRWDAERTVIERMLQRGEIERAPFEPPAASLPAAIAARIQIQRALNHLKAWRF